MNRMMRVASAAAVLGAAAVAVGCRDGGTGAAPGVQTSIVLTQATAPALQVAALDVLGSAMAGPGPIRADQIDSLLVTVTEVAVLPESLVHDGEPMPLARVGPRGRGMSGDHGPPGGVPQFHLDDWYVLEVTGNGRIDLMHLPTDSAHALVIASGEIPPGDYANARLMVSDVEIWFNTAITTPQGVTFEPATPYEVTIPSAHRTGIKTDAGFTVPDAGGDVVLLFDPEATIGRAVITGIGRILLTPVLRCWGGR